MRLVGLFRRALAAIGFRRRRAAPPAPIAPGRGRSLLNDPAFLALARAYESRVELPPRATLDDVFKGHWYAVALVPGRERTAMDRVADETWLHVYVPTVQYISVARGRLINVRRALFTGYGFVRVLDIDAFFHRIKCCEGVLGILCESGEAAVVRAGFDGRRKLSDAARRGCQCSACVRERAQGFMLFDNELIEYIRSVERGENFSAGEITQKSVAAVTPKPPRPNKPRNWGAKRERKKRAQEKAARKSKAKAKASPAPQAEAA